MTPPDRDADVTALTCDLCGHAVIQVGPVFKVIITGKDCGTTLIPSRGVKDVAAALAMTEDTVRAWARSLRSGR